jgi:magnesium transporter
MVRKLIKKRSKKAGLSPGTMVHVGEKQTEKVTLSVIDYDPEKIDTRELGTVEEAFPFKDTPTITWLNITGLHDVKLLEKLGKKFLIHPLIMEDILNTDQRPKVEIFEDYLFVVIKMLPFDVDKQEITHEQISLIVGNNFVITFQERKGDVLDSIRHRLKNPKGRLRKHGADYLAYTIIDVIVDHYFILLEKLSEKIEFLEEKVTDNPDQQLVNQIQFLNRELIFIKKSVWPLRELIRGLIREETPIITDYTSPYLKDVYDHTIQVIETVDTFREIVTGVLNIYLTSVSNKMNEVMKVLTIIATIFIPLTFIAGIYGMNFEFMPELKWTWAYPGIWGLMLFVFLGMIFYFKRKKWL